MCNNHCDAKILHTVSIQFIKRNGDTSIGGTDALNPVLRIRDILVWFRIRGSMPRLMDPDADLDPAIFVIDLQDANKKLIF
jgi:hypothetical protein